MFEDIAELKERIEAKEKFTFNYLPWSSRLMLLSKVAKILGSRNEIELAVVYGSFIEKNSKFRDIDVAVYLNRDLNYLSYSLELTALLEAATGFQFDVVVLNETPAYLGVSILGKGIVLYERRPGVYLSLYKKFIEEKQALEIYSRYSNY